jgi:hypothetical protein
MGAAWFLEDDRLASGGGKASDLYSKRDADENPGVKAADNCLKLLAAGPPCRHSPPSGPSCR